MLKTVNTWYCDACGKDMTDENYIGTIEISSNGEMSSMYLDFF